MLRDDRELAGRGTLVPALSLDAAVRAFGKILAFALVAALLAACASTPQASRERNGDAKTFYTQPTAATIYVYRSQFNRADDDSVLYVDDRLVGSTLPGTYYRINTVPGRHILHGIAVDTGWISLDVRPGHLYFVRLEVISGRSQFTQRPEDVGKREVSACCAMLENWAPGQRPLLR